MCTKWMRIDKSIVTKLMQVPDFQKFPEENWPAEPSNLPLIEDVLLDVRCNLIEGVEDTNLSQETQFLRFLR